MKKKAIIIFVTIILLLIGIASGIVSYANSDAVQIRKQLDLGQKYLTELDYEQAIVVYEAVLDIDDSNIVAYLGMAESYASMGNYEKAVEILQTGYDITADEAIKGKRDEYQKIIDEIVAKKAEEEARKRAEEEKRIKDQERAKYAVVLKPIYEAIEEEDIETAFALMQENTYLTMADEYANKVINQPYYSPENVDFDNINNGIAIYIEENDDGSVQNYCYCGDYVAGIREGNGNWLYCNTRSETKGRLQYSGKMKNDLPNGEWEYHSWWNNETKNTSEEMIKGNYIDGIGNGKFTTIISIPDKIYEYEYEIRNGDYVLLTSVPNSIGSYDIAEDKRGSSVGLAVDSEERMYIPGFGVEKSE